MRDRPCCVGTAEPFRYRVADAPRLRAAADEPPVLCRQGAIILGIGGDNSNWAVGTFLEGVMTKGFASDATDAAVHANIATVAAYRLP